MSLKGLKVLELSGLAPSPYAGLILQQHGATVIRVDRSTGSPKDPTGDAMATGKKSIAINLKSKKGVDTLIRMVKECDVFIDPYRPKALEKLGLGPEKLLEVNPKLIYARLTGFGQTGEMSLTAGHDINYIGYTGALDMIQRKDDKPIAPVNLLGDFAGGGMLCVMGILMALVDRYKTGKGQVIDAAMVDGVSHLSTFIYLMRAAGAWNDPGTNMLDTGSPFYDTYACKDGKFMAVGCIEPHFYKLFIKGLGLDEKALPKQMDVPKWPVLRQAFTDTFKTKTRDEWTAIFSGPLKDACCTPVLSMAEAPLNQHMKSRDIFQKGPRGDKDYIPNPAPRLSRTPGSPSPMGKGTVPKDGQHTTQVLKSLQFTDTEIEQLIANGDVVQCTNKNHSKL